MTFVRVAAVAAAVLIVAAAPAGARTIVQSQSRSWGGYIVNSKSSAPFNRVTADWTQPAVNCKKSPANARARFWVGLGDPSDDNEDQRAGIQAVCAGGQASYSLFYQLVPDEPVIVSTGLRPGVDWNVTMQYIAPNFEIDWQNSSTGVRHDVSVPCDTSNGAGMCGRFGAEVVAGTVQNCGNLSACFDAPPPDSKQYPLAEYGDVIFKDIQFHDGAGHYGTITGKFWQATKLAEHWGSTYYAFVGPTSFKGAQFTDTWNHS